MVLGINLADTNEGGICLHVEVLGAEKLSQTCEVHSPWNKFVVGKAEMRNLLHKIFIRRNNRANLTSLTLKFSKLVSLCLQELSG